jgi:hypothetical protein
VTDAEALKLNVFGAVQSFAAAHWSGFTGHFNARVYISLAASGPVAQGIEQQPSKLKVAGSNPAGVANKQNQRLGDELVKAVNAFSEDQKPI